MLEVWPTSAGPLGVRGGHVEHIQHIRFTEFIELIQKQPKSKQKEAADEDVPSPMEVLRNARTQLAELTGMVAESVSSFERTEDGWRWRSRSWSSSGSPTR